MRVLVSGQAAAALVLDEPRQFCSLDGTPRTIDSLDQTYRFFAGCSDLAEHLVSSLDEVDRLIEFAWACDRSLTLFLLFLDPAEPDDALQEYVSCLAELFEDDAVVEFIRRRMTLSPLPIEIDTRRLRGFAGENGAVAELLRAVIDMQGTLIAVKSAFDVLSLGLFEDEPAKNSLYLDLQADGYISDLVDHLQSSEDISFIKLSMISKHLRHKEALSQWASMLQSGTKRVRNRQMEIVAEEDDDWLESEAKHSPSRAAFEQVKSQKLHIVERLREGAFDECSRLTEDLVRQQRSNSTAEQIGKTLSSLAQQAKLYEAPSLQLEWARWATKENPADPKTFGHLADAFIGISKFHEAEAALESAESVGGRLFAETGRARILRHLGKYDKAREKFLRIAEEFHDMPDLEYALLGGAECLVDMGRTDEAIAELRQLTNLWPLQTVFWNGLAIALMDAGRLDEAIATFGKSISQRVSSNAITALNGRANSRRLAGNFSGALQDYDLAINLVPNNPVALCGRGDVYRDKGQFEAALSAYDMAIERCPHSHTARNGRVRILIDLGRSSEALSEARNTAEEFPHDAWARSLIVRALMQLGRADEALQCADRYISEWPFNLQMKLIRGKIFQRKAMYDAALAAYDAILEQQRYSKGAVHGKISVLIALGRWREAEQMVSKISPRTQSEWHGFLLKTLILQEVAGSGAASSQLNWAISKCPFFQQRKSLRSALASLEVNRRRWREARRVVDEAPNEVSNVVAFHVYAATRRPAAAREIYSKILDEHPSAEVIDFVVEMGRRWEVLDGKPDRGDLLATVFERRYLLAEAA